MVERDDGRLNNRRQRISYGIAGHQQRGPDERCEKAELVVAQLNQLRSRRG